MLCRPIRAIRPRPGFRHVSRPRVWTANGVPIIFHRSPWVDRHAGKSLFSTWVQSRSTLPVELLDTSEFDDLPAESLRFENAQHASSRSLEQHLVLDGIDPKLRYPIDPGAQPQNAAEIVKAAVVSEKAFARLKDQKEWDLSRMYSISSQSQWDNTIAIVYWVNFRRLLSVEETIRLGEGLLSKYKAEASAFAEQLLLGQAPNGHGDPLASLRSGRTLSVLIGAISDSAKLTMKLLDALHLTEVIPFQIKADCLRHMRVWHQEELLDHPDLFERYKHHLSTLRNSSVWPPKLHPRHIRVLMDNTTYPEAKRLVRELHAHPGSNNFACHVNLARTCALLKDDKTAIEILGSMSPEELQSSDLLFMRALKNVLCLESSDGLSGAGFFNVLPQLLQIGVKPTTLVQNLAIQNAVKFGHASLAWDLVLYAQEEALDVTPRSAVALLKDSFSTQNIQQLDRIMSMVHENKELWQHESVIIYTMNIVRVICYFERQSSPRESLAHILTIYDRAYNRNILIKLGILSGSDVLASTKELPDPPSVVVAFTVWTYTLVQRRDQSVINLWRRWVDLIEMGDPLIVAAAERSVAFGGFALFFSRTPQTLRYLPDILDFVLKRQVCVPDERLWTISILTYLRYKDESLPSIQQLKRILDKENAKTSPECWTKYVQVRLPHLDLSSEEAKRFVQHPEPYQPDKPWPPFAWGKEYGRPPELPDEVVVEAEETESQ